MSRIPPPNLADGRRVARSARHSHGGCPVGCEVGAASRAPCGAAPPPVSTAVSNPMAGPDAPLPRPAIAAVLTIFEGQAVFRVTDGRDALDERALFRLRRGSRRIGP